VDSKACVTCKQVKLLGEFPKNRTTKDGLHKQCRACLSAAEKRRWGEDPEGMRARSREKQQRWRDAHPEYNLTKQREFRRRTRLDVLEHYGGSPPSCACCGETIRQFLTLDHINGGGNNHRREMGGATELYLWLKRRGYPEGFRVLCFNCNAGRHWNGGVCPHQANCSTILSSK
jgi:hypothetical protein